MASEKRSYADAAKLDSKRTVRDVVHKPQLTEHEIKARLRANEVYYEKWMHGKEMSRRLWIKHVINITDRSKTEYMPLLEQSRFFYDVLLEVTDVKFSNFLEVLYECQPAIYFQLTDCEVNQDDKGNSQKKDATWCRLLLDNWDDVKKIGNLNKVVDRLKKVDLLSRSEAALAKQNTDGLLSILLSKGVEAFEEFAQALKKEDEKMYGQLWQEKPTLGPKARSSVSQDCQSRQSPDSASASPDLAFYQGIIRDERAYIIDNMRCPEYFEEAFRTVSLTNLTPKERAEMIVDYVLSGGSGEYKQFIDLIEREEGLIFVRLQDKMIRNVFTPQHVPLNIDLPLSQTSESFFKDFKNLQKEEIESIAQDMTEPDYIIDNLELFKSMSREDIEAMKKGSDKNSKARFVIYRVKNGSVDHFHHFVKLLKDTFPDVFNKLKFFVEKQNPQTGHLSSIKSSTEGSQELGIKEQDKTVESQNEDHTRVTSDTPTLLTERQRIKESDGSSEKAKKGPVSVSPQILGSDLDIGSVVEILQQGVPVFGVIRWMGYYQDKEKPIVGIEMEEETVLGTDGTYLNFKLFDCPPKKARFTYLDVCKPDRRFLVGHHASYKTGTRPGIAGRCKPPSINNIGDLCGKLKGIQGRRTSTWLDTTLFCMFALSETFDEIFCQQEVDRDDHYKNILKMLQESVVNILRVDMYLPSRNVLELMMAVRKEGEVRDPLQFLNLLLDIIAQVKPYLTHRTDKAVTERSFIYEPYIEWQEKLIMPTVQQLLNLSFRADRYKFSKFGNERLAEIPKCLIILLPTSDKRIRRIYPSLELDITDVLYGAPRYCTLCGIEVAVLECSDCYRHIGEDKDQCVIPFCQACCEKFHSHSERQMHITTHIPVTSAINTGSTVIRETMELFAILSKTDEHYVAFAKCGTGIKSTWVFFDSVAEKKGYSYVPEVVECPEVSKLLSREGRIEANSKDAKDFLVPLRHLVSQPYMCFYRRLAD